MPIEVEVEEIDLGLEDLQRELAELRKSEITIGWQGATGAEQHPEAPVDTSVAQVAAWQEYGTEDAQGAVLVPARPMLSTTFEENERDFDKATRKGISDIVDGRANATEAVEALGNTGLRKLRKTMDQSKRWADELSPATIARKGHDQPLLDSGKMRDAASWALRRGETIVTQKHDSYEEQGPIADD